MLVRCSLGQGGSFFTITDNAGAGNTYPELSLPYAYVGYNSYDWNIIGASPLILTFTPVSSANIDVVGVVISGVDQANGPIDGGYAPYPLSPPADAYVDESAFSAKTTFSTNDGGVGSVPLTATQYNGDEDVLVGMFIDEAQTGGTITPVTPSSALINMYGMCISFEQNVSVGDAYSVSFTTANPINGCQIFGEMFLITAGAAPLSKSVIFTIT